MSDTVIDSHAEFLRDLAERILDIPAACGVDQGDYDRLREIAGKINDPCIDKREDGEPMFVLLGRDAVAPAAINHWCGERYREIHAGTRPDTAQERDHIANVRRKVKVFRDWRSANR